MGKDIHIRIVKRNRETNNWELVNLYRKDNTDKIKEVDFFPFRKYDIFEILQGKTDDVNINPLPIALAGLPTPLQEEIIKSKEELCYDFKEITLADLKLYFERTPKTQNFDEYYINEEDSRYWQTNPIKYFIERLNYFLEFAIDPTWNWNYSNSDIKILYWFDN